MAKFNLHSNGYLYLIHWITSDIPFKVSTGVKIEPSQWDKVLQQPINHNLKDIDGVKVTDTLSRYSGAMASTISEVKITGGNFKDTFYNKLSGKKTTVIKPNRFLDYFESKVSEFKANNKSNVNSYSATLKHLKTHITNKRITFDDIDRKFFNSFTQYLEKLDLSKNTIFCQWKNIKAILTEAYKMKLHNNLDFKGFSAGTELTTNVSLSLNELDSIYNLNLSDNIYLDRTRDYFIIGAFTGLRFSDWHRVGSDLINEGILTIRANKTDEVCQIPIHKYVKAILDKYKGTLPQLQCNKNINDNLKTICQRAELNTVLEKIITKGGKRKSTPDKFAKWKFVTTHTARRSFCTNCILQGASPYTVMKISGHKSLESFDKYIKMTQVLAVEGLLSLPMFH